MLFNAGKMRAGTADDKLTCYYDSASSVCAVMAPSMYNLASVLDLRDNIYNADSFTNQFELVNIAEVSSAVNGNDAPPVAGQRRRFGGNSAYNQNNTTDTLRTMRDTREIKNFKVKANGCSLGLDNMHFTHVLLANCYSDPSVFKRRVLQPCLYSVAVAYAYGNADDPTGLVLKSTVKRIAAPWWTDDGDDVVDEGLLKKARMDASTEASMECGDASTDVSMECGDGGQRVGVDDAKYYCEYCRCDFYDARNRDRVTYCHCYVILRATILITRGAINADTVDKNIADAYVAHYTTLYKDPFSMEMTSWKMTSSLRVLSKSDSSAFGNVEILDPKPYDSFGLIKRKSAWRSNNATDNAQSNVAGGAAPSMAGGGIKFFF